MSGRMFVLAIDHRASFRAWSASVLGQEAAPAALAELKDIAAEALVRSAGTLASGEAGILADTQYGAAAIRRCLAAGIVVVVPAERSGQPEFIFEHGDQFAAAIQDSGATAVKALVRYNPAGDQRRNARSRRRLRRLARWCQDAGIPLMLELLVPPGPADLAGAGGGAFDAEVRPALTLRAIAELRADGLAPAWWKLEGQPDAAGFAAVARATGAAGGTAGCLVLGRAADQPQVRRWVMMAAAAPGFRGFAVGRTLWSDPLAAVLRGQLSRGDAVRMVSDQYAQLCQVYSDAERAVPAGNREMLTRTEAP